MESAVVAFGGALNVAGIPLTEVQFEGLANGSKSCLDCLDADSIFVGISATSDACGEGFQGGDGFFGAVVWKLGVYLTVVAVGDPMVPKTCPFRVILDHDSMEDVGVSISEVIFDIRSGFRRNSRQDPVCSGKVELK